MMTLPNRFSLSGRRALVTGASKGLGRTICEVLSAAGADIVGVGRDAEALDATREIVESHGRRAFMITADIRSPEAAPLVFEDVHRQWGDIDILVNNAGVSLPNSLIGQSLPEWDETLGINLRAPWLFAKAFAPGMIKKGGGKIINISSLASACALQDHGAYIASKAGLNGLTRAMTVEWAPSNVQANAVCPTVVWTPMGERVWREGDRLDALLQKVPAGRVAKPEEVADLVLFLASPASDMINGQTIFIDGGYSAV